MARDDWSDEEIDAIASLIEGMREKAPQSYDRLARKMVGDIRARDEGAEAGRREPDMPRPEYGDPGASDPQSGSHVLEPFEVEQRWQQRAQARLHRQMEADRRQRVEDERRQGHEAVDRRYRAARGAADAMPAPASFNERFPEASRVGRSPYR